MLIGGEKWGTMLKDGEKLRTCLDDMLRDEEMW